MADNMPLDFPSTPDFQSGQVQQVDHEWHWQRGPGTGGQNYGKDFGIPDGTVVVGWNELRHSLFRNDGPPDQYVVMERRGIINMPKAVHNGIRLEPQGIGGGGASYKFTYQIRYVTEADWYEAIGRKFGLTGEQTPTAFMRGIRDPEDPNIHEPYPNEK